MSEHSHQVALFDWADRAKGKHPELSMMFAIPNGGQRHPAVAKKLKAEGVKRGVPDVCLPVSRHGFHGLYIELKRPKEPGKQAGKATKPQIQWMQDLNDAGYLAVLCVGWDAAKTTIIGYLTPPDDL